MANYLLHICIMSVSAQQYPIQLQAATCLYIARRLFDEKPFWPAFLIEITSCEEVSLQKPGKGIATKYVGLVN